MRKWGSGHILVRVSLITTSNCLLVVIIIR